MPPTTPAPPPLLSLTEAAATLGVCEKTLRRMITRGQLAAVQVGGRLKIRRSAVEALTGPPVACSA